MVDSAGRAHCGSAFANCACDLAPHATARGYCSPVPIAGKNGIAFQENYGTQNRNRRCAIA